MRLFITDHHCPGDTLEDTAAVRDLVAAVPGIRVNVETTAQELWDFNPLLDRGVNAQNADRVLKIEMPLIHKSNQYMIHSIDIVRDYLAEALQVKIPFGPRMVDVHLTGDESKLDYVKAMVPDWDGNRQHWLVTPCGKQDYTTKLWAFDRFQAVVDMTRDRIQWIQVGAAEHNHRPLSGVVDMRGKTTHRQLAALMHQADGALCLNSYLMHMSTIPMASDPERKRPCIVLHGGREPVGFAQYSGHTHLDTIGCLDCCRHGGCWKAKTETDCRHPVRLPTGQLIPKCMDMITVTDVLSAIAKHL